MLLFGTLGGVLSSCPIGPINVWLIENHIRRQHRRIRLFLLGVIATDAALAGVAYFGYFRLVKDLGLDVYMGLIGGLLLIIYGAASLRGKSSGDVSGEPPKRSALRGMGLIAGGAAMCGSNPGMIMFWVFYLSTVPEWIPVAQSSALSLWFLLGVCLGDVLWFSTLGACVRRLKVFTGDKVIGISRVCTSWGLIGFGFYAVLSPLLR